ncbi:hypothetical protein BST95_08115 [Halioglobus japonicus]|uniref:DUF2721 domain-containing protein n=1 Tax=Halioglobus japonicus TaxID=930805 RepID=A0AAP8SNK6_9GAMM|nr:DUF2721 domain-containing protein [Halioglobus japonicus]AQA18204.1 hypothetical protein BST95_08115 [Halioglobus japonicus]PLW86208.1 DUF2721 domain-containing protein [Halioglobus japonicus]GHD13922.1 hypothetical protein GCM10007052_16960 [Halioglobus japonicus]
MDVSASTLAMTIHTAVAPVFLLAGIAGFLNVLSARLGRIVDRARVLEQRVTELEESVRLDVANAELRTLWRRVKIINWSIGLCTASALMVCLLVVSLFIGGMWTFNSDEVIVVFFVVALLLLIVALVLFLKEVQLATRLLQGSANA